MFNYLMTCFASVKPALGYFVPVACGQGMQVMRCMTKFIGIADKLLRNEV